MQTKHFVEHEFLRSEVAEKRKLDNTPTTTHRANLYRTIYQMQCVRDHLCKMAGRDVRITITSGYRSATVNRAVGGTPTSAHALGHACDWHCSYFTPLEAAKLIEDSEIKFDQLIYEKSRGVVHISFDPRLRRQVLTQAGGPGTPIVKGLVA